MLSSRFRVPVSYCFSHSVYLFAFSRCRVRVFENCRHTRFTLRIHTHDYTVNIIIHKYGAARRVGASFACQLYTKTNALSRCVRLCVSLYFFVCCVCVFYFTSLLSVPETDTRTQRPRQIEMKTETATTVSKRTLCWSRHIEIDETLFQLFLFFLACENLTIKIISFCFYCCC